MTPGPRLCGAARYLRGCRRGRGRRAKVALIRPHEIEIGPQAAGWSATVLAVRVIGPIVRVELCAEGQPANEPLEAEISRERYEAERFEAGKRVGLRFRRFHVYPEDAVRATPDDAAA